MTAAHAQSIRFGLKAGANLSSFAGKWATDWRYKFGFNGGGLAEFAITNRIALQPEILFSTKGPKLNTSGGFRINFSYLDLPVLVKYKANKLFFEVGPQFGYLVSARSRYDKFSMNAKPYYKTFEFGYAAGLGYQMTTTTMIGVRYNRGLSTVDGQPYNNIIMESSRHNSTFQLYAGYLFSGQ